MRLLVLQVTLLSQYYNKNQLKLCNLRAFAKCKCEAWLSHFAGRSWIYFNSLCWISRFLVLICTAHKSNNKSKPWRWAQDWGFSSGRRWKAVRTNYFIRDGLRFPLGLENWNPPRFCPLFPETWSASPSESHVSTGSPPFCYLSSPSSLSPEQDAVADSWCSLYVLHIVLLGWGQGSLRRSDTTVGGEVAQSCPTFCNPMDCSLPGSSVYGIFQARTLEWVAISFSRGSSRPRDRTQVFCTAGRLFTIWATQIDIIKSQCLMEGM